jgi:hypothetical protein
VLARALRSATSPATRSNRELEKELETELERAFADLTARGDASDATIRQIEDAERQYHQGRQALPSELSELSFNFTKNEMRKFGVPVREPAERLIVYQIGHLYPRIRALRYRVAMQQSGASCDCAVLLSLGVYYPKPTSQRLRLLGPTRDPHAAGDEYLCEECGTRWDFTTHPDCGDDLGPAGPQWWPARAYESIA